MSGNPLKFRSYKMPAPYSSGGRQATVRVKPASKPPKLRFKPGQAVKHDRADHVVLYAYRVKADPHEWFFCLEEVNTSPKTDLAAAVDMYAQFLGLGNSTPRVVYELFADHSEASKYFWDIPCHGPSRSTVPNKTLLKENPQ